MHDQAYPEGDGDDRCAEQQELQAAAPRGTALVGAGSTGGALEANGRADQAVGTDGRGAAGTGKLGG